MNLRRRHLNESQRALVAAKLATMKQGARTDLASIEAMSQPRAAELLNVGRASVQRAREVLDHGVPELRQAVEGGEVSVSAAAEGAAEPAEAQREIVARGEREFCAPRRRSEPARPRNASPRGWSITPSSPCRCRCRSGATRSCSPIRLGRSRCAASSGSWRTPDAHYPTMSIEEIAALDIPAADDAALFLWATAPMLPQALEVMARWGIIVPLAIGLGEGPSWHRLLGSKSAPRFSSSARAATSRYQRRARGRNR